MNQPTFETIENAILTALQGISGVKTVETYAGQLEVEKAEQLTSLPPAIYVAWGGSDYEWIDDVNINEAAEFTVFVLAKSLRGSAALRTDRDTGAYRLVTAVLNALANNDLGIEEIERLQAVRTDLVFITKTAVAYGIKFRTNFDNEYAG